MDETKPTQPSTIVKEKKRKKLPEERWYYKLIGVVGRFIIRFLWPAKIYYKENAILDRKAIFICNHGSSFDANPIISKVFGKNSNVVVKSEAAKSPFFSNCLKQVGAIPIQRGASDIDAVKKVLGVLNNNKQILIFPEGTRNRGNDMEMLPFKDGVATFALKTKCEIVPMMYYRRSRPFRRNRILVGEPFDLSQFYGIKGTAVRKDATDYIYNKMQELRTDINYFVEELHCNKKKFGLYLQQKKAKQYQPTQIDQ